MNPFYSGLAEILEVPEPAITPDYALEARKWDSLAIISSLALIDECFGKLVDGASLARCKTVADLDRLVADSVAA